MKRWELVSKLTNAAIMFGKKTEQSAETMRVSDDTWQGNANAREVLADTMKRLRSDLHADEKNLTWLNNYVLGLVNGLEGALGEQP